MKLLATVGLFFLLPSLALATVRSEPLGYKVGETQFEGVIYFDDADATPRRAVLVVHEWWGLNDYAKKRAEQLAQMGYVAFAVDMYGKGVNAKTMEEAAKMSGALKAGDRKVMRERINAALTILKTRKEVDPKKIASIGFCFGGTVSLELARSGAEIAGVVGFHAGLSTPNAEDAKNIKAKVLICTGADDPFVKPEEVTGFIDEMKKAKVNYEVNVYGGAVHTFTNPAAGNDPSKGQAYNAQAERRSWEKMRDFFGEIFQ